MNIKVIGKAGEGAGTTTQIIIEKLLAIYPKSICFLIDKENEFFPLGFDVCLSAGYKSTYEEYTSFVEDNLNKNNLFRFVIDIGFEDEITNIKMFANELRDKNKLKVFIIEKSLEEELKCQK